MSETEKKDLKFPAKDKDPEIGKKVSEADSKTAESWKKKGNDAFADKHFKKAEEMYTTAIFYNPNDPAFYTNRAFCHLRLENYGSAVEDANNALKIDKSFTKGYYRRGCAHMSMGKWALAQKDFEQLLKLKSKDTDAQKKLKECKKAVMAKNFSKAIETKVILPSTTTDWQSIAVSSSYDGPKWEDSEKLTLSFVQEVIKHFTAQKTLHKKFVYRVLLEVISVMKGLPTLMEIDVPKDTSITVCGDTHGQFYDVLNIFKLNGMPSETNPYLFNGDFVDRGSFSFEVIFTFFCFKVLYPKHFHLTRGNHESRTMNEIYGFQGEVVHKVDAVAFELFCEAFNWLPLGAVLGGKVLVVHGGLFSEDGVKLEQLKKIDRNQQPPEAGLMCEMLWSDPQMDKGRAPSKRGVGLAFGPDVTKKFLDDNGLEMLVRSHEVKEGGYEISHDGRCVTVFSAPNYCDVTGNKGAFIKFDSKLKPSYTVFEAVPHPSVQPMAYARPSFAF